MMYVGEEKEEEEEEEEEEAESNCLQTDLFRRHDQAVALFLSYVSWTIHLTKTNVIYRKRHISEGYMHNGMGLSLDHAPSLSQPLHFLASKQSPYV